MAAIVGVTLVGVTAIVVLGGVRPAGACSIAGPIPPDDVLLAQADLVFEGVTVASQDPNTTATIVSSADPITWTFSVDQVVKGSPTGIQQVTTARSEASCGFTFTVGHRYRVYAQAAGRGFSTSLFSGTREITAEPASTTTTTAVTLPPSTLGPPPAPNTSVVVQQPLARTGFPTPGVVAGAFGLCVTGWLLARTSRAAEIDR